MVAEHFIVKGTSYVPLSLTPATMRAIRFPTRSQNSGEPRELFGKLISVLQEYLALLERDARLVAHWELATWFPDILAMIPSLVVSCSSAALVASFFRLIRSGCRRGVRLAELNAPALRAMPMQLQPTLLVDQLGFTRSMRGLLRASSTGGVYFAHSGDFFDLRCAKALFSATNGLDSTLTETMVRVALVPGESGTKIPTEQDADRVAAELQPLLLDYRLRNHRAVSQSTFDVPEFTPGLRELARSLGAAVVGDADLTRSVIALLTPQDGDARARRRLLPEVAIVTVALALVHEHKIREVFTSDFAKFVNVALRANGEIVEYSAEEIGWQLSKLGLFTRRMGGMRGLRLDREFSRLVHELARRLGITISPGFPQCPDCGPNSKVSESMTVW